jgi:glutamate/tyrosine decarboxylase-like PLP-dependent enzyme
MTTLPQQGLEREQITAELARRASLDSDWRHGRVPLYVFLGDQDAYEVGRDAFMQFFSENALGAGRAFPSLRSMEDDIVAIGLQLFRAPAGALGQMTSGGSESIFLAVRGAREFARARGLPRGRGNLALCETAHPAFTKAALCLDLDERRTPARADGRADPGAIGAAVDDETVMIVGSAPCFPYGVIDPIEALGELARARGRWLHVDACVGGYLAPFARDIGRPIPRFEMDIDGVASLSADLHKFGFCPKPASTLFFRDAALAECAGFDMQVWPSGRFVTRTLVGTRPGGSVAGAWATLHRLGVDGYRRIAVRLMALRDRYIEGIRAIPGWELVAPPDLSLMAFRAPDLDMMHIADGMRARGWLPGMISQPPGLHLMLSMLHEQALEPYLSDLRALSAAQRASPAGPFASGQGARGVTY